MELFFTNELNLHIPVKKGDQESLLSLFSVHDRFKAAPVQITAVEGTIVKVVLEGLGEIDLELGDDMDKDQKRTIMTLFWFVERSKKIEMMRDAEKGEAVTMNIYIK